MTRKDADPQPSPELTPAKYWLTPGETCPGLGLFTSTRQRMKAMLATLAVPAVLILFVTFWGDSGPARSFGVGVLVFFLFIGVGGWALIRTEPDPRTGVWTVDEQGWPMHFVARKPPPELRKDRGLTRDAFVASLRG